MYNKLKEKLINIIYFLTHKKIKSLIIYPNVHSYISPLSVIYGSGILLLGKIWSEHRFMPSEFILRDKAELNIKGELTIYTGFHLSVNDGARLTIGSGYINTNSNIDCFDSITIGNNVAISSNVTIRDSDNHCMNNQKKSAPILIGDNVWVGVNVTILKGVRIGNGAVIAAGSVVTRHIPENCLAAGIPAKVLKEKITWQP